MKFIFHIQQKMKAVLLLMVIVITVIISSLWENSSFTRLNNSFSTIYKDRLIPANELFHINDLMHQKHLLMQKHIDNPEANPEIGKQLAIKSAKIDSILHDYEQTYLVEDESKVLKEFKQALGDYNELEREFLLNADPASVNAGGQLTALFERIHGTLTTLSQIQTTVGEELLAGSAKISSNALLVHYFEIAIVFVIMFIVQLLIITSRSIIPRQQQKYGLN